ncbi:MAG TPA: metallophosphoesterase [Caulobacteraceae bacterium]|nr:metallophosphoesterase [Caulobacteraceae bacterium]
MKVRVAHLSDIHFGGELTEAVEAATREVVAFAPTLTVVTGDLTLNGQPSEFRAAARWLARLPAPRIVTPGNHDTPYWNLFLRSLAPFDRYRRNIGREEAAVFDAPDLAARSLNSARGAQPRLNWSRGAISMRRLREIDWRTDSPAPLRLFACHHPLLFLEGAPVEGGVRCGTEAVAELVRADVDLILSGHVHNPFVIPLPGAGPGRWAIGAGTLSRRLRGTPASYTTIVAAGEVFEVTALGWSGQRFEPFQTWRLPTKPA